MQFNDVPGWTEWQKASSSFAQRRAGKPRLVAIDNLVKAYPTAANKRRALLNLRGAIREWAGDKLERGASSGRVEAMEVLLDVVKRKLPQLPAAANTYELRCAGQNRQSVGGESPPR